MSKKIVGLLVIVTAVVAIVLFATNKQKAVVKQQGPQKTVVNKEPFKIGIVVYPSFGMFYIAQEKGFFKDEGIDVQIVQISDENQVVSALASNQVQMLTSTPDFDTIVADSGVDAPHFLFTDIGYGSDGLVVKNDINEITQLKGKKVYLSYGTPSHFLFRYWSQEAGVNAGDVGLVNSTGDQVGAGFVAGKIDYGMTWEPWLSKAQERKDGKVLMTSKDTPGIVGDGVIVRKDFLDNHRDEVKSFMRAYFKAVDFWNNNKDEANAIMAKNFNMTPEEFAPMMDTVKLLDYNGNIEKFDSSKKFNIYELINKAEEFYFQDGILKTKPNVNKLVDSSLLKELSQ